jgi:hypothetical protein
MPLKLLPVLTWFDLVRRQASFSRLLRRLSAPSTMAFSLFGKNGTPVDPFASSPFKMSRKTRFLCFASFFVLGGLINSWSSKAIDGTDRGLIAFAILYSLGNAMVIFSFCFLSSIKRIFSSMFKEGRRATSYTIFGSFAATILVAIFVGWYWLVMCCIFVQWCAYLWLILSYVPMAQRLVRKLGKQAVSDLV